jgi:hypothetical protein
MATNMNRRVVALLVLFSMIIGFGIFGIKAIISNNASTKDLQKNCRPNPEYSPKDLWWKPSQI